LGIAQKQVSMKFTQVQKKSPMSKPLPECIKTIGNWIWNERTERNLSAYHLAGKMGIATAGVSTRRCENGNTGMRVLPKIIGKHWS
jgi:ribosome-binding protein aMBF1 (putative translation factor)